MTRNCLQCGEAFAARRSTRRFCRTACRVAAHRAQEGRDQGQGRQEIAPTYAQVEQALLLVTGIAGVERLSPEGLLQLAKPSDIKSAVQSIRWKYKHLANFPKVQALLKEIDQAQAVLLAFLAC